MSAGELATFMAVRPGYGLRVPVILLVTGGSSLGQEAARLRLTRPGVGLLPTPAGCVSRQYGTPRLRGTEVAPASAIVEPTGPSTSARVPLALGISSRAAKSSLLMNTASFNVVISNLWRGKTSSRHYAPAKITDLTQLSGLHPPLPIAGNELKYESIRSRGRVSP
jgi:hypothetical protein